ncbi:unnamed protein product [Adineta steineri]|uniref:Uncharacterized protein n=1 Tax=Adineta steineri TaxID=433720 RepID=A0A818UTE0_9BILA|nr:unnamed protein product [Adineta steineri]CAF3702682.1 unnamed protein product [Adineta steineri]
MSYVYRCFFILLFVPYVKTCANFTVQNCIDIPFGFQSISTMKCIQLVPAQFNMLTNYSIQNYIVKQSATKCYDIILLDSLPKILFSSECTDRCSEKYCTLFSNQPNTSIINIFYSASSTYGLINSTTNYMLSYDYFLFDTCPTSNTKTLLIIVYVLAGVIGVLTIIVVVRCIISRLMDKPGAEPYNWRWLLAWFLCRERSENTPSNMPENEIKPYTIEFGDQPNIHTTQLDLSSNSGISTQQAMMSSNSPYNSRQRQNHRQGHSSGNNSDPRSFGVSSQSNGPVIDVSSGGVYYPEDSDIQSNISSEVVEDHPQELSVSSIVERLSSKASNALSSLRGYVSLEYPIVRL